MDINKKPEVLAPAGDMECLRSAVDYGADAVYVAGKRFGMRAAPSNFDFDELGKAAAYCHDRSVKLYVACNALPRSNEISQLGEFLRQCQCAGADAFIISDLGVLSLAKKHAPDVEIHVSTQASIMNYAAANAFYELGAKRIVLARELSLQEISDIRKNTSQDLEMETFVHGAMCMSISGRCLLSNYMTGRDANRGGCAQPCRWEYDIIEKQRPNQAYTVSQEEKGSYIFNARDLNVIEHIPALIRAGVSSLKIEGRAKSAYYVACTTSAYRRAVDFFWENPGQGLPREIVLETEKISHREYSTGFYFGDEPGQSTQTGGYIRDYEVIAVCTGEENGLVRLKQRNRFFRGETADILQPSGKNFCVDMDVIYDEYMGEIQAAPHAEMTVYLKTDRPVEKGAFLRVNRKCT